MSTSKIVLFALIALSGIPAHSISLTYSVALDTASLKAGTSYFVDFQFVGGNGNVVALSDFSYGGGKGPGGPFQLSTTTDFFNELTEPFTAGDMLDFEVRSTNTAPPPGGFPDEFSFFVLDSKRNPLPTSDSADAFLYVDVNGGQPVIETFAGSGVSAPVVHALSTPEVSSISLLGIGLALAGLSQRKSRTPK